MLLGIRHHTFVIFDFTLQETEKGTLSPLDVIHNVDTLRIPPPKINVLEDKDEPDPADVSIAFFVINSSSYSFQQIHRFKIEDLTVFTPSIDKKLPIIVEKLNIKLDIRWESWTCCSSCCCSSITCGHGFETSEAAW